MWTFLTCKTCIRSNSDLRSVSDISEPEKRETKQKVLIKACPLNIPSTPLREWAVPTAALAWTPTST